MSAPRRGVALIMALLILTGLLLLGLPFLFSQSSSRMGADILAARQAAQVYSSSAINLATALAIYTQEARWNAPATGTDPVRWTDLDRSLSEGVWSPGEKSTDPIALTPHRGKNYVDLDALGLGMGWNLETQDGSRVRVSVRIEDESGKIDGNALGPIGWMEVLKAAKIEDADIAYGTPTLSSATDKKAGQHRYQLPQINDLVDDAMKYWLWAPPDGVRPWWKRIKGHDLTEAGQLADAIALHRIYFGPYRRLEDLLAVNPRQPVDGYFNDPGQPSAPANPLYRGGLTRAELERLRPFVTFHAYGAGRQGLFDLGNQCGLDGSPDGHTVYLDITPFDDKAPRILAMDLGILASQGSGMIVSSRSVTPTQTDDSLGIRGYNKFQPNPGDALLSWSGSPLNVNQARPEVITALTGNLTLSKSEIQADGTVIGLDPLPAYPARILTPQALPPTWAQWTGIVSQTDFDITKITNSTSEIVKTAELRAHPPVDVASTGLVRIETQVQVTDRNGTPQATIDRSVVVQALPQPKDGLEVAWRTQADLETLVRRGMTSQIRTFPQDARQVTGPKTQTDPTTAIGPGALPGLGDLPASPMWIGKNHTRSPWSPTPATPKRNNAWESSTTLPERTADGWLATGGSGLLWKLDPAFKGLDVGRHIGFWFCPQDAVTGDRVIMEVRNPGTDADQVNLIRLTWDHAHQCLVLRIRSPAPADLSANGVAPDDPQTDSDEACLDALPRTDWPSSKPEAPLTNEMMLARWQATPLTQGRWHFVQIAVTGSHLGSLALVVDGVVGRDLTQVPTGVTLQDGDYAALPAAVLQTNLAAVPTGDVSTLYPATKPSATGSPVGNPQVQAVVADFWAQTGYGFTIKDVFPPQGVIRIDQEYLRYEGRTDKTFERCWRGVRQDTFVNSSELPKWDFPVTQEHLKSALVLPGSFSLKAPISLWPFKGTLRDDVPDGPLGRGTVPADDYTGATTITITVTDGAFPAGGGVFSLSSSSYWYYQSANAGASGASVTLTGLQKISSGGTTDFSTSTNSVVVRLCSIAVEGPVLATEGNWLPTYPQTNLNIKRLQLGMDNNVEWVVIHSVYKVGDVQYLLNINGFQSGLDLIERAQQRTMLSGFSSGDKVVAVQTRNAEQTHLLHSGDFIGIRDAQGKRWFLGRVRYAADDFYPTSDTNDGWFTVEELAGSSLNQLPLNADEIVVGQGWSPGAILGAKEEGLTALLRSSRIPVYVSKDETEWPETKVPSTPPADPAIPATFSSAVAIGGPNEAAGSPKATYEMLVDGVVAGPLAPLPGLLPLTEKAEIRQTQTSNKAVIAQVGASLFGFRVLLDANVFNGIPSMGLALIHGEVVAYQKMPQLHAGNQGYDATESPKDYNVVRVTHRGLLGTSVVDHGNMVGAQFLHLPVGPVRQLYNQGPSIGASAVDANAISHQQLDARDKLLADSSLMKIASPRYSNTADPQPSGSAWFFLTETGTTADTTKTINLTPGTLLVAGGMSATHPQASYGALRLIGPNGGWHYEFQTNPDNGAFIAPPWLRGHYGTTFPDRAAMDGDVLPLLIGWWPRFPSALPQNATREQYRSRAYAWAGFPVRMARMSVYPFVAPDLTTSPSTVLLEWRAMAGAVDGDDTKAGALRGGGDYADWSSCLPSQVNSLAIATGTFPELDGMEFRAFWRYQDEADTLAKINDHMNATPPRILSKPDNPMMIKVRAPVAVLAAEEH